MTSAGATLLEVLSTYASKLEAVHGRLYLSGINQRVHDQIVRTGKLHLSGPVQTYQATPIRGQSTRQAVADAQTWLVDRGAMAASDGLSSDSRDTMSAQR